MTEADIGMTEQRSKNALGRSVPVRTMTDVEDDRTFEDGSPRPVCTKINPLDPSLLGITFSPTEPPGTVGPICDIIIDHIILSGKLEMALHNYPERIDKVILQ